MDVRYFTFIFYKNGDRSDTSNFRRVTLNDFNGLGFVNNPEGLGLANILNGLRIGNRNLYGKTKSDFLAFTFESIFKNYLKYFDFKSNVVYGNNRAVLEYTIPEVGKYKRDIYFENMTKGEMSKGYLPSQITIRPESFWYQETVATITLEANVEGSYNFANNSELPCEIAFQVYSKCNELLVEVNTAQGISACKLQNLDELEYPMIRYSSEDGNSFIYNQGSYARQYIDILNSRYVNLDSNYIPFLKIPKLENANIIFKSDTANTVRVTLRSFFISV